MALKPPKMADPTTSEMLLRVQAVHNGVNPPIIVLQFIFIHFLSHKQREAVTRSVSIFGLRNDPTELHSSFVHHVIYLPWTWLYPDFAMSVHIPNFLHQNIH